VLADRGRGVEVGTNSNDSKKASSSFPFLFHKENYAVVKMLVWAMGKYVACEDVSQNKNIHINRFLQV
jgi:hypothetical protein